jgi:hypothetical protein
VFNIIIIITYFSTPTNSSSPPPPPPAPPQVHIHRLIACDTLEERMLRMQASKQHLAARVRLK